MENEVLFEAHDAQGNYLEVHCVDNEHLRIMARAHDGHWTTIGLDNPEDIIHLIGVLNDMLAVRYTIDHIEKSVKDDAP